MDTFFFFFFFFFFFLVLFTFAVPDDCRKMEMGVLVRGLLNHLIKVIRFAVWKLTELNCCPSTDFFLILQLNFGNSTFHNQCLSSNLQNPACRSLETFFFFLGLISLRTLVIPFWIGLSSCF